MEMNAFEGKILRKVGRIIECIFAFLKGILIITESRFFIVAL
jgi:hypothetical protein